MKRTIIIFAIVMAGLLGSARPATTDFEGLKSREILEKIRSDYKPTEPMTIEQCREAVKSYALTLSGGYRDYFSDKAANSIAELTMLAVVHQSWWPDNDPDADLAAGDLHNIVPANRNVSSNRLDYPPGVVSETFYDNSYWKSGIGEIYGIETNFYEPAEDLKGDFSRIYMYMAAVYARPLWAGRGAMVFADGYYPLLTPYGRELLLAWHREDPVDEMEVKRNTVIAEMQGLGNPFVEISDLAEYVWGSRSDEAYGGGENDDPQTSEPIMLKAVYSVSIDGRIDFRSPYVDAGSAWTFDGRSVEGNSMSLEGIAPGRHELTFSNPRTRGKLIITVEP